MRASPASAPRSSSSRQASPISSCSRRGDGVGGAWQWNTYPGIAVDIPSFSYRFSFEKRADWSRVYSPGREPKAYAEHCVDKYGVRDRIRLNSKLIGASFDEDASLWRIELAGGGELSARFVIGDGCLQPAQAPGHRGRRDLRRRDHAHRTLGAHRGARRQARGGDRNGRLGDQVIPAIAPEVERLTVFQRTPIWCLPELDAPIGLAGGRCCAGSRGPGC